MDLPDRSSAAGPGATVPVLSEPAAGILGALGSGVATLAPDGRITWANEALSALGGHDGHDLVGELAQEIVHPADRVRISAAIEEVHSTGLPRPQVRVRGRGRGRGAWLDVSLRPMPGTSGHDGSLLLEAVDVSEAVRAQRSLEVLAGSASDIGATTDRAGLIMWVSPSIREGLGMDPDDLAGQHAVVSMRDVTEELRAKRELARSEEQFRMALMGAPEGMALTDSQDRIVQANPALCELLGTSLTALIGHRFREFIPDEDREHVDQWRERLLRGGMSIERCQHRLVSPTSEVWVDHSIGIMRDELGNPQLFVHQFADRTAARRLQADLAYRASHDVQTGLANRDSLRTRLGQRLGCPPESAEYVGVLFCDIDNLKPINDRHGHLVGDAVISTVAGRLERAVRRQDVVARVGGDEFVILLDHCASLPELRVVAGNVHSAASHPVDTAAGRIDVTISVGAVLAESSAETDDALARADAALYRAKRSGGDRISVEGLGND